jgi:UDP-glucuronate 4-epimerase
MVKVLITGGAGFIAYHLQKQCAEKFEVLSFDLLDALTPSQLERVTNLENIYNHNIHQPFITQQTPDVVIHLAAETGISGSLTHPEKYFNTNVAGTLNVLEQCRLNGVKYLIYASSSSVYAPNQSIMHEEANTQNQLSFYGTTKKMSETLIENYCKQFGITAIGLRFFTVYGSFTRVDMAAYKFMQAIERGDEVTLFNEGNVFRDFTHVSDVVTCIEKLVHHIQKEPIGSHQLFNIGYGSPISVSHYAQLIAQSLNKPLHTTFKPLPANELVSTHSDTTKLQQYIGYRPVCNIEDGIVEMTNWFKLIKHG